MTTLTTVEHVEYVGETRFATSVEDFRLSISINYGTVQDEWNKIEIQRLIDYLLHIKGMLP